MKLFSHIPGFLKNKYLIALGAFVVWILFFDRNDFFIQRDRARQLQDLEKSKVYYSTQIASERHELEQLKTNPATLEKYAREKYLMKRDNEDLYIIPEKQENSNN
jgi:cell division protein DivIC